MIDMSAGLNMEDEDYQTCCVGRITLIYLRDSCVDETKKILNRYFVLMFLFEVRKDISS